MASLPEAGTPTVPARATGSPVAPHVAALLELVSDDGAEHVRAGLDRDQLAGTAHLPGPLPVHCRRAPREPASRRLALLAAIAVVDRADLLLRVSGGADAELVAGVGGLLELRHGRFRVVDAGGLEAVHASSDLAAVTAAHRDLARAARAAGEPEVALWHTARGTVTGDELLADGLVELAGLLLGRGDPHSAYDVAREAVDQGTGDRRARAFLAAGRASLWSGHLVDARRWLHRARSSGIGSVEVAAARVLVAVDTLLDGAPSGGATGAWAGGAPPGGGPSGAAPGPGAALAALVAEVAVDAPGPADRVVLDEVERALRLLDDDPDAAAALLVRAAVRAVPAWSHRGVWAGSDGCLSPLAEAHLRVVQSLVLLCQGDVETAGAVLDDAVVRLPVAHVVGGLGVELARRLDHDREGMRTRWTHALSRIAPRRQVAAGVVAALRRDGYLPGPVPGATGSGTAARAGHPVARAASMLAGEAARGPGAVRVVRDDVDVELPPGWAELLTVREVEVTRLVVEGMSNRDVAQKLCVSVRTVEVHLGRTFRKVGVRSRSELVVLALRPQR